MPRVVICEGQDGEIEMKAEYRGKITYLDEKPKENWVMGIMLR